MSGFGNIGPFSEEEIEARYEHIQSFTLIHEISYTDEGCKIARRILKKNGITIFGGMTGWEIVDKANKIIKNTPNSLPPSNPESGD